MRPVTQYIVRCMSDAPWHPEIRVDACVYLKLDLRSILSAEPYTTFGFPQQQRDYIFGLLRYNIGDTIDNKTISVEYPAF